MIRQPSSTMRSPNVMRDGFTIVELLVSIAVIFVLITTAFVAFRLVKKGADRTQSVNALRQMMAGYNLYSGEHKQRLMPGYVDPTMLDNAEPINPVELDLRAKTASGLLLSEADTGPYIWRLAPYLDNAWQTFMADYRSPAMNERLALEYGDGGAAGVYGPGTVGVNQYGIAARPSFGLNSIYVGGDSFHGGGAVTAFSPWDITSGTVQPRPNKVAATRVSDVKSPAKLIVFGPAGLRTATNSPEQPVDPASGAVLGYFELRAPFGKFNTDTGLGAEPQWLINPVTGNLDYTGAGIAGVPLDRLGLGKISVGHLDGSTGTEELARLGADMSRWSPFAIKVN